MEKHEKEEVVTSVSEKLILAEQEYNENNLELQCFRRVVNGLTKLGETRKEKMRNGEDVSHQDEFLDENRRRLGHLLSNSKAEGGHYNVDFHAWATDIENDIRAQDPLMLSFDSADADVFPKTTSSRFLDEAQTISSKGGALLNILKSNGKLSPKLGNQGSTKSVDQSFFWLTTIAWVFAVFGMMITIGFLAADFWYAQKHVAIHVERSKRQPQELPAITICNFASNIQSFSDYPTSEYPGLPIFGIQRFIRYNQSTASVVSDITYPGVLPGSPKTQIEDVIVANDESECDESSGLDVRREMTAMRSNTDLSVQNSLNGKTCHHCLRLGYKRRLVLHPPQNEADSIRHPAINLILYRTKLFAACQTEYHRRNIMIVSLFVDEIQKYAEELEGQGILDFNDEDKEKAIGVDWYRVDSQKFFDFCCNVYFFSGFFYPSRDNADISYRFDHDTAERWMKTGSGPYYSAFTWSSDDPVISGPHRSVIEKDFYTFDALELYIEEAEGIKGSTTVSPHAKVAAFEATDKTLYRLKKVLNQGKIEYKIIQSKSASQELALKAVDLYNVQFDFETFETETIITTPTMTWPEFVVDVFEFIGLFTGICIFTLIVAPAHSLVYPNSETEQK
ncbi:unnamed protein product [Agarophyton chilense]|eukprot:gb/GEZJ01003238.1/.p1 GENE.gb/GEZJ01003238.1/~~gb/GEZJ01003238.1/.p1  ORF type:complete len:621 (+),score=100.80 gb/GEZJ01003238.1/:158-2020(+)